MDQGNGDDEDDNNQRKQSPQATESQTEHEPAVSDTKAPTRHVKKKNSNGKPTRPLSAYNLFYRYERTRWLEDLQTNPDTQKIPPVSHFLVKLLVAGYDRNWVSTTLSKLTERKIFSHGEVSKANESYRYDRLHSQFANNDHFRRHISKRWNELPESEKEKYKKEAAPYYTEFLEEKKRYKAKRSKEGAEERKYLEEAAQKEAKRKKESHAAASTAAAEPEANCHWDDPYGSFNHSTVASGIIHPLSHGDLHGDTGVYASMMLDQQRQAAEAQRELLGLMQPRDSLDAFINAASLNSLNLPHYAHMQQQTHDRSSTDAILQVLLREQQHILANRLLAESQQGLQQQQGIASMASGDQGAPSTQELHRLLALTRDTAENPSHDAALAAFLGLLRRDNAPGPWI